MIFGFSKLLEPLFADPRLAFIILLIVFVIFLLVLVGALYLPAPARWKRVQGVEVVDIKRSSPAGADRVGRILIVVDIHGEQRVVREFPTSFFCRNLYSREIDFLGSVRVGDKIDVWLERHWPGRLVMFRRYSLCSLMLATSMTVVSMCAMAAMAVLE